MDFSQLDKFLNFSSVSHPDLLEKMQEETPIIQADYDYFLNLPCNEEYLKRKKITIVDDTKKADIDENKKEEIDENKKEDEK
jgi:hypothetical protein